MISMQQAISKDTIWYWPRSDSDAQLLGVRSLRNQLDWKDGAYEEECNSKIPCKNSESGARSQGVDSWVACTAQAPATSRFPTNRLSRRQEGSRVNSARIDSTGGYLDRRVARLEGGGGEEEDKTRIRRENGESGARSREVDSWVPCHSNGLDFPTNRLPGQQEGSRFDSPRIKDLEVEGSTPGYLAKCKHLQRNRFLTNRLSKQQKGSRFDSARTTSTLG